MWNKIFLTWVSLNKVVNNTLTQIEGAIVIIKSNCIDMQWMTFARSVNGEYVQNIQNKYFVFYSIIFFRPGVALSSGFQRGVEGQPGSTKHTQVVHGFIYL